MNKEDNPLFSYVNLDSQRIKDTFFSPPKRKKKTGFFEKHRIALYICASVSILALSLFIFFSHYSLIAINKNGIELARNATSLLRNNNLVNSISYTGTDASLLKHGRSFIHLALPPQQKNGFIIDLKTPINLNTQKILMHLKKPAMGLRVALVLRDNLFYSNSLSPIIVSTEDIANEMLKTTITLTQAHLQNTNIGQITQLQFFFLPIDTPNEFSKKFPAQRWVMIKDVQLIAAQE